MYKLSLCSKILYDTEIIESNKTIQTFKNKYEPSPILLSTDKWKNLKSIFLLNLKQKINTFLSNHHENIIHGKIHFIWLLHYCLKDELNIITKNYEWSENMSEQILRCIDSSLYSLYNLDILNNFNQSQLSDFIQNNINNQLFSHTNNNAYPCVFYNIIKFNDSTT